jgi:HlyD family secretion protein
MSKAMKRILSLVVIAVLVGGGVWAYFAVQSRGNVPRYRLVPVERGPLTAAVSASGNLNAVITVQVGSQVSGQIKELRVDFNSPVRRDQIIAQIDPETFEAKVNQAKADVDSVKAAAINQEAQVERARADLENARAAAVEGRAQTAKAQVAVVDTKRDLDRKSQLFERDLIAKSDLDSSQAAYDSAVAQIDSARAHEQSLAAQIGSAQAQLRVAQAALASARAQIDQKQAALKQAQVDLDHTTIRAPVDGVVVSRQVDVGQTVAASLQAPTLFTIAQDLTQMQVETSVDEADIGRIRDRDHATFTVDAFPGETFVGTVTQIRKAAQVQQNVVTYTVVIGVDNPGGRLLPGMTANVKLVTAEKPSVLKVSNAALRYRPTGADAGPAGGTPSGRGSAIPGGPAAGGGQVDGTQRPGGGQRASVEAIRDRLVKDLSLTEEQQRRLDPILQESRQQMAGLRDLPEGERPAKAQKIREASRQQIREILTPAQQARYDEMSPAGGPSRQSATAGRVWVQGPDGKPKAVAVTLGISDGNATEVLHGELTEGQPVIVGTMGGGSGQRGPTTAQPGGPRLRL